jgi:hypothetical protein
MKKPALTSRRYIVENAITFRDVPVRAMTSAITVGAKAFAARTTGFA